jgi:D-alanyl-D-alanine carboxypeptidase
VALAEGRLLREESWRRAYTPARLADGRSARYGAGWFLGTLGGAGTVEHGGDINGFSSDALWIPERGVHVVVLANVERGYANPATVTARIAERLLDLHPEPAVALAAEALDAYVGVYTASETDRRVVLRDGGTLYSRRGSGERQELRPVGGDRFVYPSTGTATTFVRGADGVVTGMLVIPRMGPEQTVSPRISADPDGPEARGPAAVEVPVATLERYVGSYRIAPQLVITVRRDGAVLRVLPTGQAERALVPIAPTRFAIDGVPGAVLEFDPAGEGPAGSVMLLQGGQRMEAPRIP